MPVVITRTKTYDKIHIYSLLIFLTLAKLSGVFQLGEPRAPSPPPSRGPGVYQRTCIWLHANVHGRV